MGVPWPVALGCVFISGVAFLVLTFAGIRQLIIAAIPPHLFAAVAGGIGLFIALIGLKNAGIVVSSPATSVTLGDLHAPAAALALFGLVVTAALAAWKVRGAILIGIARDHAGRAGSRGQVSFAPQPYDLTAIAQTAFQLDLAGVFGLSGSHGLGLFEILFVFLFVDLFDNIGTLVGVTRRAGLIGEDGRIPKLSRILFTDSIATIFGSLAGTSTVTSYVESAAGVQAGGRTGLTAIVTGLLFLLAMFVAPYAQLVPLAATAPALILVGALMMAPLAEIAWDDARNRDPRLPHHGDDPAHLLDRQRACLRHHRLCAAQAAARQDHADRLAAAGALGFVRRALRVAVGGIRRLDADRRTMIQAAAAAALLAPTAGLAAPLPQRRKPRRLRPGDTVGLVEPAYFTADAFDLDQILATIRAMGLVPRPAPNILSRHGYLAGTDEERARAINAMFADPEVRAIFAVRGGWGSARILPISISTGSAPTPSCSSASATSPRCTWRSPRGPIAPPSTAPMPPAPGGGCPGTPFEASSSTPRRRPGAFRRARTTVWRRAAASAPSARAAPAGRCSAATSPSSRPWSARPICRASTARSCSSRTPTKRNIASTAC